MEPVKQEISKKSNKIKKCAGKDSFQRMNYLYQVRLSVSCVLLFIKEVCRRVMH
jgi:hypothetical protein